MAADFNGFKIKYPELVSSGDANKCAIEDCIVEAVVIHGTPMSCPKLEDSIVLAWTAHCVSKSGNNPDGIDDSSGPVSSESVGSVSYSYQLSESKGTLSEYYKSTTYGMKYLSLLRYCKGSAIMVAP